MISFRYHVVSLVAVFVALAIGVIAGTTVIDQELIDTLRSQRLNDQRNLGQERATNDTLRAQLSVWDAFGRAELAPLVRDKLSGREVVIAAVGQLPAGMLDAVRTTLTDAGARAATRIDFTARWSLPDDAARQALTTAVGSSGDPPTLVTEALEKLATRLRSSEAIGTGDADVVRALEGAGFIALDDEDAQAFPPRGAAFVVLWPGTRDARPDAVFGASVARALATARTTSVAEPVAAAASVTDRVTGDGDLAPIIPTVDHVDTMPGRYALVLALAARLGGEPAQHFGTRRRTAGVVPTPKPS